MCTYLTETIRLAGNAKGAAGWFDLTDASVYVDHASHGPYEHTLNIDFRNPALGASARVAVELTEQAALALAEAIHRALAAAPPGLAAAPPGVAQPGVAQPGMAQPAR